MRWTDLIPGVLLLLAVPSRPQGPVPSSPDGPARLTGEIPPGGEAGEGPRTLAKPGWLEEVPAEFLGDPWFLGFAAGSYRPPAEERLDPDLLRRVLGGPRPGEEEACTYGYVIFRGRAVPERLRELGVEPLFYHPNNAWAVRIPVERAAALAGLPEARWVGFARPWQKVHPALGRVLAGRLPGERVDVCVNLFAGDLNAESRKIPGPMPVEATIGAPPRPGNPAFAGWSWETRGRAERVLRELGLETGRYREEIRAYEARADLLAVARAAALDFVAFVEWLPPARACHDRVVPQLGQDYSREAYPTSIVTVGVVDSGFHLFNGGFNGHVDLSKQAVGWSYWSGGCGSPFCDEASEGFHGTHVLGTVCGEGRADLAYRGTAPYLGSGGATHRLFLVKGYTYQAFLHMRQAYTDPWNNTTPRPALVTNSWGSAGCINSCSQPAYWIGSEAGARTADDEVFNQNQLYLFAAGNEGGAGGKDYVAGTIGVPAVAKNVLAVGMSRDGNRTAAPAGGPGSIVSWSSHGPCGDGRWKPNVNAPGCVTMSTAGGTQNGYKTECGTSMSSPAAAGVLAVVAERYPEVLQSAPLYRAWAMATAVTRDDAAGAGGAGQLPSSHLNAYGLGRVSALKAHDGGGALPWTRTWSWQTIQTETDWFDVIVGTGAKRLLVVLTWDDPAAGPGANPAAVSDLDLYLDREPFAGAGNAGEYASQSSINTVEHVVVEAPPAGTYRIKVYPFANAATLRWGAMAIQILGDTTPTGPLTPALDRPFIRPGESVQITLTARADDYVATNVFVEELATPGFTRTGSTATLKDLVVLAAPHDPGDNGVHLGDIRKGDTRAVVYAYRESAGTDAVRNLQFRAFSDNWGSRPAQVPVTVDGTPPGAAGGLASTSHQPGVWSNNPVAVFAWTAAPDNLSGLEGYGWAADQSQATIPPAVLNLGPATGHQAGFATSLQGWYFKLRARDRCGNWSSAYAWAGPYLVDTEQPGLAAGLRSTTHQAGAWSGNPQIAFAWTAAPDNHSGLAGYGLLFSDDRPARPGATRDLGPVTAHGTTLQSSAHGCYFNLRSVDRAGNWDDDWASAGPFLIDALPPTGVSVTIDQGAEGTGSPAVTLQVAATDPHSGPAEMRFANDGGSWSPWFRFAASRSWNLTDYGGSAKLGLRKVVAEVRDAAGNSARAEDSIFLYLPVAYFGQGCAGSLGVPTFAVAGIPGRGYSLDFVPGNTAAPVGSLYLGASRTGWLGLPLPLDLAFLGIPGCAVNISLEAPLYTGAPVGFKVSIPREPSLVGTPVHFQWLLFLDPSRRLVVTTRGATVILS